uniref:3-hydroxy-3-methylglutaryl-coenzyme A reductase n=1 Tax=Ditylenchus dipsaci TaxID=166011 RepID=A0A915DEW6_9BILA
MVVQQEFASKDFTTELTDFVERLIEELKSANESEWKTRLAEEVQTLTEKHCKTKSQAQFVVGDDSSNVFDECTDVEEDHEKEVLTPITSPISVELPSLESASIDDATILRDLRKQKLKHRDLEAKFGSTRAVDLRRKHMQELSSNKWSLYGLPYKHYDYSWVNGACCENIIGYVPIPTGVAGPLKVNEELFYIPMSTTEGALIASTNRGCKAVNDSGGITSFVTKDGMSRAPVLKFRTALEAHKCQCWVHSNFAKIKESFEKTSRFVASTGDAMGMNMVTKGVTEAMQLIQTQFPNSMLETISGNMCVDKKASAINWMEGRGKSVISEATISKEVIQRVLKTSVEKMVNLGTSKLLIGAMNSVTIGGSNAHAANMVAAIFLATGQDAAQVVSSSMCSTQLQKNDQGDLYISCTMPCLEIGTVGGGTILSPQQTCLNMLGCCGPSTMNPGDNAKRLAQIICSTVLAGELSLLASQCTGDLVRSHLKLNRSSRDLNSSYRTLHCISEEFSNTLGVSGENTSPTPPKSRSHSQLLAKQTGRVVKEVKRSMCDQSFH